MKQAFADSGACRCHPAPRITTWLVALAIMAMAGPGFGGVALAQNAPPPASNPSNQPNPVPPAATEGRAQAPVGHRQPRPQDLPPNVLRDEGGAVRSPVDRDLDQKMQICRGC
jgi:hypothetical protein